MDALSRFSSDLVSWYWWLSVVLVGIAINLASSYLKPPIDDWWSRRSTKRRHARKREEEKFNERVKLVAGDPTLLIIECQRAAQSEQKTIGILGVTGIDLVLFYVLSSVVQSNSFLLELVTKLVAATIPFMLGYLLSCIKRENEITELVSAARRRYEMAANPSFQRTASGGR